MKTASIFTGLVNVNKNLVGTAIIYKKIVDMLYRKGYKINIILPEESDLDDLKKKADVYKYNDKNNKKLIDESDITIFGAYPPIHPMLYAYKNKKIIMTYLWSIAPVGSLEFKDFEEVEDQKKLHEYIKASYNLSLLLSDKIFCRDEGVKKLIFGSLVSMGRANLDNYNNKKDFSSILEVAPFGIETGEPKHKNDIYRSKYENIKKKDFLLMWNGGIWNWNDGETLIRAMKVLEKKNIKLILQGFKHPSKHQELSKEAERTLKLAEKLAVIDKNVFFIDQWVPYEERGNYLTECDAGIAVSPNIPEANFFLKTRIYDYLWASLPVIVNDQDAFAPIISREELGVIFKTGDHQDLADKIVKLSKNKSLYKKIKNNFKRFKKDITWEKSLKPVERYIKNIRKSEDKYGKSNSLIQDNIAVNKKIIQIYEKG